MLRVVEDQRMIDGHLVAVDVCYRDEFQRLGGPVREQIGHAWLEQVRGLHRKCIGARTGGPNNVGGYVIVWHNDVFLVKWSSGRSGVRQRNHRIALGE